MTDTTYKDIKERFETLDSNPSPANLGERISALTKLIGASGVEVQGTSNRRPISEEVKYSKLKFVYRSLVETAA